MIYFFLILFSSFLEVVAMVLIKKHFLIKISSKKIFNMNNVFLLLNPLFIFGSFIFILSIVLFFFTLSKINLLNFFIYFSVSKLIFAFYLSDKFLDEKINRKKIFALFLLLSSIIMISYR